MSVCRTSRVHFEGNRFRLLQTSQFLISYPRNDISSVSRNYVHVTCKDDKDKNMCFIEQNSNSTNNTETFTHGFYT